MPDAIVHESGHYVAARRFGMRVVRFSIGFGPVVWKHKPKDSPTVYQVALIPFLAYVQIAGLNPYEESDPKDPASYANASLWARIVTIAAGPLTNYFFASVLIFFGLVIGGREVPDAPSTTRVVVDEPGPAQTAGVQTNDRVVAVNSTPIASWDDLKHAVSIHPGEPVDLTLDRNGETVHKMVTPGGKGDKEEGLIHVRMPTHVEPVRLGEAAKLSVIAPPVFVYENLMEIGRVLAGKSKLQVSGPPGIVKEAAKQAKLGPGASWLQFLGRAVQRTSVPSISSRSPRLDFEGRLAPALGAEVISRGAGKPTRRWRRTYTPSGCSFC